MGSWYWLERKITAGTTEGLQFTTADSTFRLNEDDVVVFVVGPTGSGKSTFVRAVTQAYLLEVGQTLQPFVGKVQAIRCELTDEAREALGAKKQKNIVFVDTPSFHIDPEENTRAERETSSWLKNSGCKSTRVGIIYMHRTDTGPIIEPIQNHLNTFIHTFPVDFIPRALPKRLHCVLGSADIAVDKRIADHREKLQTQLANLKLAIVHGSRLEWNASIHPDLFVNGDADTAWDAIVKLFSPPGPIELVDKPRTPSPKPKPEEVEDEDDNGLQWFDERFGPDSSYCISMPIFS